MLTTMLRTVGGSVMFAIPKAILEGLNLRPGAAVGVSLAEGKLIVDPHPRQRYSLAELVAQCDPNGTVSTDEWAWMNDPAVGSEEI